MEEKKKLYQKWWFWLCAVLIVGIAIGVVIVITISTNNTDEISSNINQSLNERKTYIETQDYNGIYKFSLNDDNGYGHMFNAYGVIQINGKDCKIKYTHNKTTELMETDTLSGTCGLNEEDDFYFSIYTDISNKEVCTYKGNKLDANIMCELVSSYNLVGCFLNKKLNLTLMSNYQDIYSAFSEIEKQEKERKEAEKKAQAEQEEKDFKASCKTYTYEQMARNPDKFKGTNVKLTGEVVQALYDSNSVDLRVNITKKGNYSTYYVDTVYIVYYPEAEEDKILEDDIITIYGTSQGDYTYTSTIGSRITLPLVYGKYITINN